MIALDLEPGATSEGLKALRLHRQMQNRCHVFIKLNGNPSRLVEDAFAGSARQIHGRIRLNPLAAVGQRQGEQAADETVLLVLNGYAKVKRFIPTDVTCTVADNRPWLEAVLDHQSELFPLGFPKKILSTNHTSTGTSAELPCDDGEDKRAEGGMAQSLETDEAANHE